MKVKGSVAERELVAMFWETGEWSALRIAGSGRMNFPSPDVLASNKERNIAVECKFINGEKKYFPKEEVELLEEFANGFGAEPWIGIKFSRKSLYFIKTKDLDGTKGMFLASLGLCQEKGIDFSRLIGGQSL